MDCGKPCSVFRFHPEDDAECLKDVRIWVGWWGDQLGGFCNCPDERKDISKQR